MAELRHLFPANTANPEQYIYASKFGRGEFAVPPRDNRQLHASRLIQQVRAAEQQAQSEAAARLTASRPKGITLDFRSDPGFKLHLEGLEMRRSGIELVNSRVVDQVMHATVFIPEGKTGIFVHKLERYAQENTPRGKPWNKALAESITAIRIGALESFWTDAGEFPTERETRLWWEVWLRDNVTLSDVSAQFRITAQPLGIEVSSREIRFPERRVLLARSSLNQWSQFDNLFDILAELRLAKRLAGEFVELSPRGQAEWIAEALTRIQPPPQDAPAVCHFL